MKRAVSAFLFLLLAAAPILVSADERQFPGKNKTGFVVFLDMHAPGERQDALITAFALAGESFELDAAKDKFDMTVFSLEKVQEGVTYDTDLTLKPRKMTVLLNQYHTLTVKESGADGKIYVTIYRKGYGPKDRFTVLTPRHEFNLTGK